MGRHQKTNELAPEHSYSLVKVPESSALTDILKEVEAKLPELINKEREIIHILRGGDGEVILIQDKNPIIIKTPQQAEQIIRACYGILGRIYE